MANKNLSGAKQAKQDEFYTQLGDIQLEINAYLDYNPDKVSKRVRELVDEDINNFVKNKRGVFEYILGGEKDTKLLDIRIFEKKDKLPVYKKQTDEAKKKGVSNCPLCAIANNNNSTRIYKFEEMDADHVTAWTKGGSTDISNCQMLCKTHNRAKGSN